LSYPGQNEIAYRAHAAIYEAIAAHDPDRSERVIRGHLDQVSDLYWRASSGESAS
jgi:DNA-binding FadR family transcriptional regulator